MKPDERRYSPRLKLRIPMKIRNLGCTEEPARLVESSNISVRGVSFFSDLPLRVGMPVQVTLTMPEEVAGKHSPEWCCRGRVVHIDSTDSPQEEPRIGVELQYYEVNKEQRHGRH